MTFCVLGAVCSVYDPQLRLAGLTYSNPMCDGCRQRGARELNLLRYDYVDLSQLIPKPPVVSDTKIFRPDPESSPPLSMAVWGLRSELVHLVCTAERELRRHQDDLKHFVEMPVREGFAVDRAVSYLRHRIDLLPLMPPTEAVWDCDDPARSVLSGPDVILCVGALHRRSRRLCGLDSRTICVPGHCPQCEVPSLRRADDDPALIWCVHCRVRLTNDQYVAAMRGSLARGLP